jgi:hypothetical protein
MLVFLTCCVFDPFNAMNNISGTEPPATSTKGVQI